MKSWSLVSCLHLEVLDWYILFVTAILISKLDRCCLYTDNVIHIFCFEALENVSVSLQLDTGKLA